MPDFVQDTFTGSSGTNLTSHTGEVGATWTTHPEGTANMVLTDANRTRCSGNLAIALASGTAPTAEYDVSADFHWVTTVAPAPALSILARHDATVRTGYMATYTSGEWRLRKVVAGSVTQLASYAQSLTNGQTYHVKLEIRDDVKKLYVDGIERCSSSDNAVTAIGRVGIEGFRQVANSTGIHLDNFVASTPPSERVLRRNEWMKLLLPRGTTSHILQVFIRDLGTGLPMTGLTHASTGLKCGRSYPGSSGGTDVTIQSVTAVGTYEAPSNNTSIRFAAKDGTNIPGVYELHLHNDWLDSAESTLFFVLYGVADMEPVAIEIQLTDHPVGNQSGDAFDRLGEPAGTSIAADIASVTTTLGDTLGTPDTSIAGDIAAVAATLGEPDVSIAQDIASLAGDIETAQDSLDAISDKIGDPANETIAQDIADLSQDVANIDEDVATLTQDVANVASAIDNLDLSVATEEIVDAFFNEEDGIESGLTFRGAMRCICAILFGEASALNTLSPQFKDLHGEKTRVTGTTSNESRSSIVIDTSD